MWTRGYLSPVRGGAELSASEFCVTGTVFSNVFLHSFGAWKWPRLDSSRAKWLRSDFEVTSRCSPEVTSDRVFSSQVTSKWLRAAFPRAKWPRSDFEPNFLEPNDPEVTSSRVFSSQVILKWPRSDPEPSGFGDWSIDVFLEVQDQKYRWILYLIDSIAYGLTYDIKSKCSRTCAENLFPNILA